jgi:hypothetical protein
MKALIILGNKYFLWVLISLLVSGGFFMRSCQMKENERLQTYNRQLQGKLTDNERELQELNIGLGISRSKLVTQHDLIEQLKRDKQEVDKNFEEFKKKHDLQIKSRDITIARLRQKIDGGTTEVNIVQCDSLDDLGNCIISYNWEDTLKRFRLEDPNIFQKNNEIFRSEQIFKIYGEIWQQEEGFLQTRRLILREMFKNKEGEYKPIPNAKAKIVDSEFQYYNSPTINPESSWKDLFKLRVTAIGAINILPNCNTNFGLGLQFFEWKWLGVHTYTSLSFNDVDNLAQHVGISFNPKVFDLDLNIGAILSVGTPFTKAFNQYLFNTGLVFYLHQ